MITKKDLMRDLDEACEVVYFLKRQNKMLRKRNDELCRENIALIDEVDFLNGKIARAINYCECKKREKNGTPAWLREVIRDA